MTLCVAIRLRSLAVGLTLAVALPPCIAQTPFQHPDRTTHWYTAVPVPAGVTWQEARIAAAEAGGYLATSTSAAENSFLFALVDRPELWSAASGAWRGPWLGGVQHTPAKEPDQGWAWAELEPMAYAVWSSGQPNDDGSADRIHFGGSGAGRTAGWADAPATARLPGYVIEFSGATAPRTVGLMQRSEGSFDGYTLLYPSSSKEAWLLDSRGRKVHSWVGEQVQGVVELLPDGHLLRTGVLANPAFPAGGGAGVVEKLDWQGRRVWKFELSTNTELLHHDFAELPNGNLLLLSWEKFSAAAAIAAGRDPNTMSDGELWSDEILEVHPPTNQIVWRWRAWDHLVQDHDAAKANHGVVANHPERIDVNYDGDKKADWLHSNALDYNARLDQIMISVRHFDELWVIDHSTTTREAASASGGRSGRGGDLLYRWGNPAAYRAGTQGDQKLFVQHDAHWITDGLPGAGNILIFNNGSLRPWSSVEEITPPPVDGQGNYQRLPNTAWGPSKPTWRYEAPDLYSFFSSFISGCQRLPNGNTLICSGAQGRVFEVGSKSEVVWEYENPITGAAPLLQGDVPSSNFIFRAPRYPADYPGLAGRRLTPTDPIESYSDALLIEGSTAAHRASVGTDLQFDLRNGVPDAVRYYQLATSATPGRFELGFRDVRLAVDPLCLASMSNAGQGVFQGYFGRFDVFGRGAATLSIPASPALVGLRLHSAFVVIDAHTGGIETISNTVVLDIER